MTKINHRKYIAVFALTYFLGLISLSVLEFVLNAHLGTGVSTGMLIASVYASIMYFVKDHARVPEKNERRQLTIGFILISYLISFGGLFLLMTLQPSEYSELRDVFGHTGMIILGPIGLLILSLLYYIFLGFCIAMFAKISVRKI